MKVLKTLLKFLHGLEDSVLVALITSLLFISFSQIVLRNTGMAGLTWADSANRVIVLWLALFGAMRASRLRNHIAIDLMSHYGNALVKRIMHILVSIFAAAVSGIAAWYSLEFVIGEYEYPSNAFLNVPTWLCEAVIPFALAVIALRFAHQIFLPPLVSESENTANAESY